MQLRSATSSCRGVRPVVAAVTAAAAVPSSRLPRPQAAASAAAVPGTQQQRQQSSMANTPASTTRTGAVFPEQYEEQLSAKIGQVRELFAAHKLPSEIEVFRSATSNFRMRAEFTIWHERSGSSGQDEDLYYVMFEKPEGAEGDAAAAAGSDNDPQTDTTATAAAAAASNTDAEAAADAGPGSSEAAEQPSSGAAAAAAAAEPPQSNGRARGKSRNKKRGRSPGSSRKQALRVRIDDFPVASQLICSLMPLLRQELLASDTLREKLFQVNFHTTLSKQGMITLLYHKQLDDSWQAAAKALRAKLLQELGPEACSELHVIGRSRKQKVLLDAEHVTERMEVAGRTYEYMQVAGCFSQPNGGMCQHMLNWAVDVTKGSSGDLLELYCGNGNFTLPLAQNFKQVVATEVSKGSVAAARHNIEANGVSNIFMARMSSEEFVETWRVKGTRQRLTGLDWEQLQLKTLLVDPPRAGLDPDSEKLLREFDQVVYISCNPQTLAQNLNAVADTHDIERFAVFDQFPYTHHLECGVLLRRKEPAA